MTKHTAALGCIAAAVFAFMATAVLAVYITSTINTQHRLANMYESKVEANKTELSNLKQKLPEAASVTEAQMQKLEQLFTAYAEGRSSDGGSLMQWTQEAVPNVDQSTFLNLQNIVASTRDAWTRRQKELVDISRVYNTNLDTIPSGWILATFGRFERLDPIIVITQDTQEAFETGIDKPLDLFPAK